MKTTLHALVAEHSLLPFEFHAMIVRACEPAVFRAIPHAALIAGIESIWFAHRLPSGTDDEAWVCQGPFDFKWYCFGPSTNGNGSAPLTVTDEAPLWVLADA